MVDKGKWKILIARREKTMLAIDDTRETGVLIDLYRSHCMLLTRSSCSLVIPSLHQRDAAKMLFYPLVCPTYPKSQTPCTPSSSLGTLARRFADHRTPALRSTKNFSSIGAEARRENDLPVQTLCASCDVLELNCVPVAETPLTRAVADELSIGGTGSTADCVRAWDSGGSRYTRRSWRAGWRACWWRAGA